MVVVRLPARSSLAVAVGVRHRWMTSLISMMRRASVTLPARTMALLLAMRSGAVAMMSVLVALAAVDLATRSRDGRGRDGAMAAAGVHIHAIRLAIAVMILDGTFGREIRPI